MTSSLDLSHLRTFEEMEEYDKEVILSGKNGTWGFLPPTDEVFEIFQYIQDTYKPTKVLEIGFNAGHSTTYQLETFPQALIHTIGPSPRLGMHRVLKRKYGKDRFKWFKGRTQDVRKEIDQKGYDFAFVDGSHLTEAVNIDLHVVCNQLKVPLILVDNTDGKAVREVVYNKYVKHTGQLKEVKQWNYDMTWHEIFKSNEITLFTLNTKD